MDEALKNKIIKLEQRISALENIFSAMAPNRTKTKQDAFSIKKKTSLREFLITKKPSNDVQRVLAIGYFFEKFKTLTSFNADDLLEAFEKAKEKKPLNVNDKVNMNIKNGHMEEASVKKDNKKTWYLTNSGVEFIENNFQIQK